MEKRIVLENSDYEAIASILDDSFTSVYIRKGNTDIEINYRIKAFWDYDDRTGYNKPRSFNLKVKSAICFDGDDVYEIDIDENKLYEFYRMEINL